MDCGESKCGQTPTIWGVYVKSHNGLRSRGVHCKNTKKQRVGNYRVINIHKRKKIRIFLEVI